MCLHCDVFNLIFDEIMHSDDPDPNHYAANLGQAIGDILLCCRDKIDREQHLIDAIAAFAVTACRAAKLDRDKLQGEHISILAAAMREVKFRVANAGHLN